MSLDDAIAAWERALLDAIDRAIATNNPRRTTTMPTHVRTAPDADIDVLLARQEELLSDPQPDDLAWLTAAFRNSAILALARYNSGQGERTRWRAVYMSTAINLMLTTYPMVGDIVFHRGGTSGSWFCSPGCVSNSCLTDELIYDYTDPSYSLSGPPNSYNSQGWEVYPADHPEVEQVRATRNGDCYGCHRTVGTGPNLHGYCSGCDEYRFNPQGFDDPDDGLCENCVNTRAEMHLLCLCCGELHDAPVLHCDGVNDDTTSLLPTLIALNAVRNAPPVQGALWSEDEVVNGSAQFELALNF